MVYWWSVIILPYTTAVTREEFVLLPPLRHTGRDRAYVDLDRPVLVVLIDRDAAEFVYMSLGVLTGSCQASKLCVSSCLLSSWDASCCRGTCVQRFEARGN